MASMLSTLAETLAGGIDWLVSSLLNVLFFFIIAGGILYIALSDTWRERAHWVAWTLLWLVTAGLAGCARQWAAGLASLPLVSSALGAMALVATFGVSCIIFGWTWVHYSSIEPDLPLEPTARLESASRESTARDYLIAVLPAAILGWALRMPIGDLVALLAQCCEWNLVLVAWYALGKLSFILRCGIVWLVAHYAVGRFERKVAPVSGLWHGFGLGALAGLLSWLLGAVTVVAFLGVLVWQEHETIPGAFRGLAERIFRIENRTDLWSVVALSIQTEAIVQIVGTGVFGALAAMRALKKR